MTCLAHSRPQSSDCAALAAANVTPTRRMCDDASQLTFCAKMWDSCDNLDSVVKLHSPTTNWLTRSVTYETSARLSVAYL